jgi:hypothetical protein
MGRVDGIALCARLTREDAKGGWDDLHLTVYSRFEPPLDLGLSIRSRAQLPLPGGGRFAAYTGDASFDRTHYVYADEAHRAAYLLSPALRAHLRHAQSFDGELLMTDQGIASQRVSGTNDDHWLQHCVHTVLRATEAVYTMREKIPAASLLSSYIPQWARFCQQNGLQLITAPLGMWGRIGGAEVYTYAVRTGEQRYELEVWLQFEQVLGLGLLVQPMRNVDRFKDFFGEVDHKLGDAAFDDTFLVRVSDAAGVDALLGAPLRALLMRVHHEAGPLSLTDEGASIRMPYFPAHPGVVPHAVETLIEVAAHVHRARFGGHGSPYR